MRIHQSKPAVRQLVASPYLGDAAIEPCGMPRLRHGFPRDTRRPVRTRNEIAIHRGIIIKHFNRRRRPGDDAGDALRGDGNEPTLFSLHCREEPRYIAGEGIGAHRRPYMKVDVIMPLHLLIESDHCRAPLVLCA